MGTAKKYENLSKKELLELVQRLSESLEHHSKLQSLGEVSVGISHEISNQLSVLQSSFNRIDMNQTDPKQIKLHNMALKSIQRLVELGDSLSQIAYGGKNISSKPEVFSAGKLIEDTLKFMDKTLERAEIELYLKLDEDLWIKGIQSQFQQVILNMVINAKDAMFNSQIKKLTITAQKDLEKVLIIISDTGDGIAKENLPQIFDGFFTTKVQGEGTGLGLSLSKQWIESMQGTIRVESEPNEGASFILQLPLAQEEVDFKNKAYFNQALLVHKDVSISKVLATGIHRMGMNVEFCHTTEEAYRLMEQQEFDLVFAGYELDNMDGVQLFNSLKAKDIYPWKTLLLDRKLKELDSQRKEGIEKSCDFCLELPYSEGKIQTVVAKVKEQKLKTA